MDTSSFVIGYQAGKNSVEKGPETEETTVVLDLSGGDQVVTPSSPDKALSQVTIQKPDTLVPGNIAEGVDIAGVVGTLASGGGGTLPSGLYLSAHPIKQPTSYAHRIFMLQGERYATWYNAAGSGNLNRVAKWNGSSWDTIWTTSLSGSLFLDGRDWTGIEYNGKMHFTDNSENTSHVVFDGSSFTASTSLPANSTGNCFAVYQNKLVVYTIGDGSLYEWDEDNNAWVVMATIASNTYTSYYPFVVDDQLYLSKSTTVYHYNEGVLEEVGTLPWMADEWVVADSKAYFENIRNGKFYGYDVSTNISQTWSVPKMNASHFSVGTNDISFCAVTGSSNSTCPFFAVNIVE